MVRGTSGSGKTTVVRALLDKNFWNGVYVEGRKKPLYYLSESKSPQIAVLGHYEATCGGCDTIGSAPEVYNLIHLLPPGIDAVVAEGLLLSEDKKWTTYLADEGCDVRVIFLSTPLESCLDRVRKRREKAGNDKPLNVANTTNRVGVIERARRNLLESGIICRRASSEQALEIVERWLGLTQASR